MRRPLAALLLLASPALADGGWRVKRGADGVERCYAPTRRLSFNYEVIEPSAAPLGTRSLWVTRDGGATWRIAATSTTEGPLSYEAPQDAEYGFAITGEDSVGNAMPPPAAGLAPELRVVVDSVPPRVTLDAAEPEARPGGTLSISWRAEDAVGVDQVRVEGSLDGGRTWADLASGIASGSASCAVPPGAAGTYLLRAAARDFAGSRGFSAVLRLPVASGGTPPVQAPPSPPPPPVSLPPSPPVAMPSPMPPPASGPSAARACYRRAGALRLRGKPAEAEAEYRRALEADPGFAPALNDLGILLFRRGETAPGLEMLQAAQRAAPSDPDTAFNLGYALLASERPAEAVSLLALVLESRRSSGSPETGEAVWYLARAQASAGQGAEAVETLKQYSRSEDPWQRPRQELLRQLTARRRP